MNPLVVQCGNQAEEVTFGRRSRKNEGARGSNSKRGSYSKSKDDPKSCPPLRVFLYDEKKVMALLEQ